MLNRESRSVTQDDVAKLAGVSRSIVSYVLNGGPRPVAEETRQRVLKAIQELGYRPNKFAQRLIRSQNRDPVQNQIGIIMSDVFMLRRPYYADILAGIHNTAHAAGHHIRFIRFFQELKDPLLFNELIHKEEISGLIMVALDQSLKGGPEDRELLVQIRQRIRNIVCIEFQLDNLPTVHFDRQEAAYKGARHLLDLGVEDLLYVGPQDDRVLGFQRALLEAGKLKSRQAYLYGSNLTDGLEAVRQLRQQGKLPEGILGGTDEVSIGILRGFHEAGIQVPEEVSLVSIDDIEMAAFANPPLTSVHVETFEMGRIAVRTVISQGESGELTPAAIMLPTRLIVRESCRKKGTATRIVQ